MARVFLIDPAGLAVDFALTARELGHEVRHFIQDTVKTRHIGAGVGQRVRSIAPHHRWADLVICTDNSLYLDVRDRARKDTKARWIGATRDHASWENERERGQELLQAHGIPTAPYTVCNTIGEAIAYVKKRDARLVCKPCGDDRKDLSYVSKGPEDMLYMLNRWAKLGTIRTRLMLQDFISGVAEFGAEGWFTGEDWAPGWHESFEHKKLMNDEVGPNTGEMGTVNAIVDRSAIAEKVLKPLTPFLAASGYTGFLSLNCIVDKKGGIWPLEFTCRFGWPCFNLQTSQMLGDPVQDILDHGHPRFMRNVCTGVVMAIPDFPYSHATGKEVCGVPIWGFDGRNKHHHPCEMQFDKDAGAWETAGDYACVITGHGKTVSESADSAYRMMKSLTFPNSPIYRTDIGKKCEKALASLHKLGLAKSIRY